MTDTPDRLANEDRARRMRALRSLLRFHEPGRTPFRRITPAMADDLLRWATTLPDETLLDMRGIGPAILRWIRDNQPQGPSKNESQAARSDFQADSTFAAVLQRMGWHVEVFWNGSAGWFTARLVSLRDRDGHHSYPGGFLIPFDDPIGASGASPAEALANLSEAVFEWA